MLPGITDLYSVASTLKARFEAQPPDDARLLAGVRDLVLQMRLVMRLGREENAFLVAAENRLDEARADLAMTLLTEVLAKRISR